MELVEYVVIRTTPNNDFLVGRKFVDKNTLIVLTRAHGWLLKRCAMKTGEIEVNNLNNCRRNAP